MRRLAAAVAGVAALAVMLPSLPWHQVGCPPTDCTHSEESIPPLMVIVGIIAYLAIPSVLLVLILVGLLAIRERRDDIGARPSAALRAGAKTGLKDGAVAVGAAFALAAAMDVGISVLNGWPPIDNVGQPWLTRLTEAGVVLGCLVLAHLVRASRTSRPAVPPAAPA